jgi:hypothetical protein
MIIFESDWQDYKYAIADTETTNRSWVHLAAVYKSMGVRNYYFHLALLNPDLQGIDPHDAYLTLEQKTAIAVEVENNPWYFFREVLRLPVDGGGTQPFRANRAIISLIWCFLVGIDYGLIMPRQTGKSVGTDGLKIWLLFFYYMKAELFLLTKDAGLRAKNIKKIKDIVKLLPPYLNRMTKADTDNTETITCVLRENKLWTGVGQIQQDLAIKTGRGYSILMSHTDEAAFIPNAHISIPAMLAAGTATRNKARERGILYGNIFTTTAGKKDTEEGKFVYHLINDGMYWDEKLFDCPDKATAHEMVRKGSKGIGYNINGTFSHRQLGLTDEWLRQAISESRQNEEDAKRDFLNKWSSGTLSNPLSVQLLTAIAASERDPSYVQVTKELYQVLWYIPESEIDSRMSNGHYVIGLDSGNAVGRDANAFIMSDIRDLSVVATCTVSESSLHKYSIWLGMFMVRYPNTTLIIENKSSGQHIIDTVSATLIKFGYNPFKRIYNKIVDEHVTRETDFKIISSREGDKEETFDIFKGTFGFQTTGNRRAFIYDTVLQEAAKATGHLVKDRRLSTELRGLETRNGRVDHIAGGHDDTVIAWLLIHWFVKYSKNLSFYGIDPKECLSLVSSEGAMLSPEKLEERRRLAVLNIEISELKEKLIGAPDIIETKKYEKLLQWKVMEANKLGETTYTIDSILEDVKKNKVTKKSLRNALMDYQSRRSVYR